jgi:DNA-binding transcriptional ArsR family regulator
MMEKSNLSTPDRVFAALGNPVRWQIVLRLAGGQALAATSVAQEFGRDFDGISKHLRLLRAAGILASRRGDDRRVELYFIPEVFLKNPGQLDLGSCVISLQALPDVVPLPARERKPRAAKSAKPAPAEPEKVPEKIRPQLPAPEAEEEIEEEYEPQGFGEMLARTGALPLALGGNPRGRHFQR